MYIYMKNFNFVTLLPSNNHKKLTVGEQVV